MLSVGSPKPEATSPTRMPSWSGAPVRHRKLALLPGRWAGGSAGGADAAQLACHTAAEAAARQSLRELAGPAAWKSILPHADRAVLADPAAGLTTLLGFCISNGFLAGASRRG